MNLNCNGDVKSMGMVTALYEPFTFKELYDALNDDTLLKILLYLREKNPKVPLKELMELTGKTEKEVLGLLNFLSYKQFIDISSLGEYDLNPRSRNVLNSLLSQ